MIRKVQQRFLYAVWVLTVFLTLSVMKETIYAAEGDYVDLQLFEKTQKMDMPKNTASYWFTLPEGTKVDENCYLMLNIKLSNTLIYERSSITLEVNETALETQWILDLQEDTVRSWKVEIPADVLKIGELNELKIITTQRSIEGDCADIDNPSNWVNLLNTSYLHIAIDQFAAPRLNHLYTFLYDGLGNKGTLENEYILPKTVTDDQIEGMFQISSAVGMYYPYNDRLIYRVSTGTPSSSEIKNKFFIGYDNSFSADQGVTLPSAPMSENMGYISVADKTTAAPYYKTLLIGKDAIGLQKAVRFFSVKDFMEEIAGTQITVVSDLATLQNKSTRQKAEKKESGYYKLDDFGYDSVNLAGAFHQSANFSFLQPDGIQSGDDSYILVRFRHSKALESDHSLMTVYFDEIAAGSVKLSASNADYGEIKVAIPEECLKKNTINVTIDCYNYLGKIDCSKDYYDTAWTVIDKATDIYFEPGDTGVIPTLINTPSFYSDGNQNNIVMGLSKQPSEQQLALACELATRAGQNNREAILWSLCRNCKKLTEEEKKQDMIFLQQNNEISLPEEVQTELGIVPLGEYKYSIAGDVPVTAEMLSGKIIVQVIRSPWDFGKRIYIITYDEGASETLDQVLSDKAIIEKLTGQIAFIDQTGKVTNYERIDTSQKEEKVPVTWERIKYLVEKRTGVSIWIVIGAIALIIIAVIVLFRVIGNRKRFKQAAKNMERANQKRDTTLDQNEDFPMDEEEIVYKFQEYGDHYPEDEE
ncbi:MAG: cellulose biosynthesis cyclic di-GMP-binding regulatory protein BcsB [bacterium]|nr:cellulose biosynthesis cyclic di-GMP-binding regulatory protein BcsB [bacterium]